MTWTKERMHALLDSKPAAVLRACLAIYERQTDSEKQAMTTSHNNGIGFSAFDAEFCSDIAQRALRARQRGWNFTLSSKQLAVLRNKMKRYHRQLCEIANAKEAQAGAVASSGNPVGDIGNIEEARMVEAEIVAIDHRTPDELAMGLSPGDYL